MVKRLGNHEGSHKPQTIRLVLLLAGCTLGLVSIAGLFWTVGFSVLYNDAERPVLQQNPSDSDQSLPRLLPVIAALDATTGEKLPTETDDPQAEGWDSEAFHRVAGKQLKLLGKDLARSPQRGKTASNFDDVLHSDFSSTELRPAKLQEVYSTNTLRVFRNTSSVEPAVRSRQEFWDVINRLTKPFSPTEAKRVAIKVTHVDFDQMQLGCLARMELSGPGTEWVVQQTAVWKCTWLWEDQSTPPQLRSIELVEFEEIWGQAEGGPLLQDLTQAVLGAESSLRSQLLPGSQDWLTRIDGSIALETFGHQGVAVGDINGDVLEDLYVCQSAGLPNRLLVQQPDGTVKDFSATAGVDWLEPSYGALLVDLDNDGDQDLALACDNDLMLLANDGRGKFSQQTLLPLSQPGYSLAAADYDSDGDLDIYVCVYYSRDSQPGELPHPVPFFDATNGGRNVLFRNDGVEQGVWQFRDVTESVGLNEDNNRWSFAASWEDYDNDGDADLYVANDFGRNNLYRNIDGRFQNAASQAGVEDGSFGMSVTWGDYNRDGLMDLYVSNMYSSAGNRVTYQRRFKKGAGLAVRSKYQYLARGNSLFENAGDGTFGDVSPQSHAMMGRWAWSSRFVDFNNDGWEDLLVTNGWQTNKVADDL